MESVTPQLIFSVLGIVGVVLLLVVFFSSRGTSKNKQLDSKLTTLFYKQHAFLVRHKADLFEYEKVKELLFFQKEKFFNQPISEESKEKYIPKAEHDFLYIQDLVKKV